MEPDRPQIGLQEQAARRIAVITGYSYREVHAAIKELARASQAPALTADELAKAIGAIAQRGAPSPAPSHTQIAAFKRAQKRKYLK